MKTKHSIKLAVLAGIFAFGLVIVGECLWWNNARSSYPRFLVGEAPAGANDLLALAQDCGEPVEVEPDGADKAVVRCGTFWPFSSVWSVPRTMVSPALK